MTDIEAGRLVLRPIQKEIARQLLEGRTPSRPTFAAGYPSQFSMEVMELVLNLPDPEPDLRPLFMIRKAEGDVIGEIGGSFVERAGAVVVGFSVVEPCWGRGYATEALRALISHMFEKQGVERVVAETFPDHDASRRVMEKAGMRWLGSRTREEDGREVELVVYEAIGGQYTLNSVN
ncbi:MAG: GNAT family N-acetyltransferase [Actinomycetota bacterium]|nr:GNAT family N-acetyltransferase [Actinomycetota bacterium]